MGEIQARDDRMIAMRQQCVPWISGRCHGGQCPCKSRLDKDIAEEAERRRIQRGAAEWLPQQRNPHDSKEI